MKLIRDDYRYLAKKVNSNEKIEKIIKDIIDKTKHDIKITCFECLTHPLEPAPYGYEFTIFVYGPNVYDIPKAIGLEFLKYFEIVNVNRCFANGGFNVKVEYEAQDKDNIEASVDYQISKNIEELILKNI